MAKLLELFKWAAVIAAVYFFAFYESEGNLDVWFGIGCVLAIFVFIWIQLEFFVEDFEQMQNSMEAERIRKGKELNAKREAEKANPKPFKPEDSITDPTGLDGSNGSYHF